jgi:hypothetical protein
MQQLSSLITFTIQLSGMSLYWVWVVAGLLYASHLCGDSVVSPYIPAWIPPAAGVPWGIVLPLVTLFLLWITYKHMEISWYEEPPGWRGQGEVTLKLLLVLLHVYASYFFSWGLFLRAARLVALLPFSLPDIVHSVLTAPITAWFLAIIVGTAALSVAHTVLFPSDYPESVPDESERGMPRISQDEARARMANASG